jgi:predicted CoA-substrate-specific enzyme activase
MSIRLGIDVGAVGVKAALVLPPERAGLVLARNDAQAVLRQLGTPTSNGLAVLLAKARRARGRPLDVTRELLDDITQLVSADQISGMMLTGTGGPLVAEALAAPTCNDFQACARAINLLHPGVRTTFEIGGETSRYIRLEPDPASGTLGILDYSTNGDCAAGTGAFLDQQASRLQFAVEEIADVVAQAERAAQIAGRCSVFAKSDMIHAQQKGYGPAEVLRGLCNAVARNFKSAVIKGRTLQPPIALLGGVAANSAVVQALREAFELNGDDLFVPEAADALGAVGAALLANESDAGDPASTQEQITRLRAATQTDDHAFLTMPALSMKRVKLLRNRVTPYHFPEDKDRVDAYLGLDIGSVGTKLVLIDENGDVIHSIFTRTDGRPIEVVSRCLREMEEAVGWGVRVQAVGSTGSGRELIGVLVGADSINDEITAHKTGATFVADRLLDGNRPDTIFEIGGQDSKYISLQPEGGDSTETIVVDFTMNDACAAGTGSFLEERAEELGVAIKDEFSEEAFRSKAPLRLGERCTVFMERDVNSYMQRGAQRADIIAGLAYSIAYNYINRVVRGRHIGDCIFFQGGTAYNDAVAAAFSMIIGKKIIVPPHNVLMGAIGVALLAKEKIKATGASTRFRGYDLRRVNYTLREFTCNGCTNHCAIQEFTVEGEKTFWGDKCSDRYRKQAKSARKPVIPDLIVLHHELLHADDGDDPANPRGTIGIPLAMYSYDLLPLWRRFFRDCGFRVVVSSETNRQTAQMGLDTVVAEPCFPITVAHGHVAELMERNVDTIWLPNLLSVEDDDPGDVSFVCAWGQTLPFVVRQAPAFQSWKDRILCPTLRFKDGRRSVERVLVGVAQDLGVSRSVARKALEAAWGAQDRFRAEYERAGRAALEQLVTTGEPGMVIVGRPYNIHDPGVSLATARKLRKHYGVNVLPIDALPVKGIRTDDINSNMYWAYGKRILAAAKLVGQHSNLHIIYITNFKCGPDSFLKGFIRAASGKPFLSLQFDGHSNDAGTMTRCEAYLDSKGILRWWRTYRSKPVEEVSKGVPSTSRQCTPALPG